MRIKTIVPTASCLAVMMAGQAMAGTFEKTTTGVVVKPDSGAAKEVRLEVMGDNLIHVVKLDQAGKQASGASEAVARMKQLEEELRKAKAAPAAAAPAGGGSSAEVEKLKTDLAAMKKRAMEGENAKEAVVLLKSKVAKLEAQLKGGAPKK